MANIVKDKSIKYLGKDFNSLKRDLISFSQAHHSGVFQDFNETSPGMAILELCAYIGDTLSFYQDMQFEELKQESARQIENVASIAKQHGYKPIGKRSARTSQTFFVEVPAINNGNSIIPDESYSPTLAAGAKCVGPAGIIFETVEPIEFSASYGRMVTGSRFDQDTGLPTHFALRKNTDIIAGETVSETFTIGDFEQFKTIELTNKDVLEILSVTDSDSNDWIEVDYLAQDTVFSMIANLEEDSDIVPYVMKLTSVPRRFISDRNVTTNKTRLIFGSGDGASFDDELIPNIADLALPLAGKRTFTTFALDPQNFLKTRSMGLSPLNTVLTVTYRVGGGPETNVAAASIKSISAADLQFSSTSLDVTKMGDVRSSLECVNFNKTDGGALEESISEIKANSSAYFAAQNRVVTREDYIVRVLSLPSKFGKPEKVYVKRNNINATALDIHVLAKDADGYLTLASNNLKNNIKTYLSPFRLVTDSVNILDSNIINLKVSFGIMTTSKLKTESLTNCLVAVKDYFKTENMQIGQPIVLSDLSAAIQAVHGVISVYNLQITNAIGNVNGLSYSMSNFDVRSNTKDNVIYCPENSIFEVKFPNKDIAGVSK